MRKRASFTTISVQIATLSDASNFFMANLSNRNYFKGKLAQEKGIGDIFYAYNRQGRAKATVSVVAGFPYTETSLVRTSDCHGRLMAKTGTIKQGNKETVAFDRRFVEGFVFDKNRLERVDFPGGYFDAQGDPHYLLTDRLGSVVLAVSADNKVEARYGYYPYGEQWRNTAGQQRRLASKERETLAVPGDYDFGPRTYRPGLTLWDNADRYASKFPWLSPFSYCGANPVKFIDPSGDQICLVDRSCKASREYCVRADGDFLQLFGNKDDEYCGNDEFIEAVKKSLTIYWGTDVGKLILSFLINDPRKLYILKGERSYTTQFDPNFPNICWIKWNHKQGASLMTLEGVQESALMDLFHELSHMYDNWHPKYKVKGDWFSPNNPTKSAIRNADKVATHFENRMRKALDLPLRTCYLITSDTNEVMGPIIISDDGKNYRSLYFDEDEKYYENGTPNGYPYY